MLQHASLPLNPFDSLDTFQTSLSTEIEKDLQFHDPRCLALEVADLAHKQAAPETDCMLAGLRRLILTKASQADFLCFTETLDEALNQLINNPEDFKLPTLQKASVTSIQAGRH